MILTGLMPRLLYLREMWKNCWNFAANFVTFCLKKMYALNPSSGNSVRMPEASHLGSHFVASLWFPENRIRYAKHRREGAAVAKSFCFLLGESDSDSENSRVIQLPLSERAGLKANRNSRLAVTLNTDPCPPENAAWKMKNENERLAITIFQK